MSEPEQVDITFFMSTEDLDQFLNRMNDPEFTIRALRVSDRAKSLVFEYPVTVDGWVH